MTHIRSIEFRLSGGPGWPRPYRSSALTDPTRLYLREQVGARVSAAAAREQRPGGRRRELDVTVAAARAALDPDGHHPGLDGDVDCSVLTPGQERHARLILFPFDRP